MSRKESRTTMKVIPRFVYNPDKAERGLKAMADILAAAARGCNREHHDAPHRITNM